MVWIGLVDPETRTVRPACQAGHVAGYLDHIAISIDDIPSGPRPDRNGHPREPAGVQQRHPQR